MKKILLCLTLFCGLISFSACSCNKDKNDLPTPEIGTSPLARQFGIDKNINVDTLDNYLFRDDVVYRDMRMLKEEVNYEAIGGDSYLSGFVQGFEVVPFPYLAPVEDLPEELTNGYTHTPLFRHENGEYIANFDYSMTVLESLFPKDKAIFLMCGGAGYAGATKAMLIKLGWDANKLYNVGGYWYYDGNHNVQVKRVTETGDVVYDFYKVAYHDLTKIGYLPQPQGE